MLKSELCRPVTANRVISIVRMSDDAKNQTLYDYMVYMKLKLNCHFEFQINGNNDATALTSTGKVQRHVQRSSSMDVWRHMQVASLLNDVAECQSQVVRG